MDAPFYPFFRTRIVGPLLCLTVILLSTTEKLAANKDRSISDSTIERLTQQIEQIDPDTNKVKLLNDLGLKLTSKDPKASKKTALEALELAEKLQFPRGIAGAYNLLALHEDHLGNYEKAIEIFQDALDILEPAGSKEDIAPVLQNISKMYHVMSDFDNALAYGHRGLSMYQSLKDNNGIANTLNSIGLIYRNQNEFELAEEYHRRALSHAQKAGNNHFFAIASLNLAGDLDYKDDYDLVLQSFQEALVAFREMGDKKGEAIVYNNIGTCHLENDEFERAVEFLLQSIEKTKEIEFKALLAHNYNMINHAYAGAGNFEQAHAYTLLLNTLNEEMLNEAKVNAITEMETQYQVKRKEQAILNQQNEIAILEKDKQIRNYLLIIGVSVVILIGILVWVWFRNYQQKRAMEELAIRHQLDLYVREIELLKRPKVSVSPPETSTDFQIALAGLLSERELEVFQELANGKTNKEMADALFVSVNTIKSHLKSIYEKLDVKNRTQAVKKVLDAQT